MKGEIYERTRNGKEKEKKIIKENSEIYLQRRRLSEEERKIGEK